MAQPLPPARRAVLLTLADMANQAGLCWPSIATVAEKCCLSVRSVFNALKDLEGAGLLVRRTRIGRSSVYSLIWGKEAAHGGQEPVSADETLDTAPASPPPPAQAAEKPMAMQPPQPEPKTQPAPATAAAPTAASIVDAMRAAGLLGAYECPALVDLVDTSADAAEFTEAAAHAAQRKKGFAWALARVAGRRKDAAAGGRPAHVRPADVARSTVPGRRGRDPVLKQIEAEAAKAAPPSATIRERLAQLRASFASGASKPISRGTV